MSEFRVEVVRVGPVEKHPNADSLSITKVLGGYPCILRTGDFREGDLAVYVPVDAVVPADDPRWAFLGVHRRIKAKRLRGIFSMGLLTPTPDAPLAQGEWREGDNAQAALRIEKYEPEIHLHTAGEDEADPGSCPVYDIEGLRKWGGLLAPGEPVWISEKIHGANARFVHDGTRLWVASRTRFKREDPNSIWWKAAVRYDLANKLAKVPGLAIYGEVYGQVQDLRYGAGPGEVRLAVFDALDTKTRQWLRPRVLLDLCFALDLPVVPTIYEGPWSPDLVSLAEGKSTVEGANHVREGIVVKPLVERFDARIGRVFLKLPGEGYLTRKEAP